MELDVSVTAEDFHHAQLLHTRLPPRTAIVLLILSAVLLVLAIVLMAKGIALGLLLLLPMFAFLIARTMIRFVFLPENSLRAYSQLRALHTPQHFRIDEDSIEVATSYGTLKLPWDHFPKWKEDERLYLLYQTDTQMILMPKRAFSSAQDCREFASLLQLKSRPAP